MVVLTTTGYNPACSPDLGMNRHNALGIASIILIAYMGTRLVLETKRTSIRISNAGISMTDWLGRKAEIPWHDIASLITPLHDRRQSWFTTRSGKRYAISIWLEDLKTVIDEIISRAELTEVRKGLFNATYTRPAK
jgi:hypothetical protein